MAQPLQGSFPALERTTKLCSMCQRLFIDESLFQLLRSEEFIDHCCFSDLDSTCPLCSLIKRLLVGLARAQNPAEDPDFEHSIVRIGTSLSDIDFGVDEDESSSYKESDDGAWPSNGLLVGLFAHAVDQTTGDDISCWLECFTIPEPILRILATTPELTKALYDPAAMRRATGVSSVVSHWTSMPGFYASESFWRDENFTRSIRDFIKDCHENHGECRKRSSEILPSLLLEVPSCSNREDKVVLRETSATERIEYVTLSYCWGGPQKLTTTTANLYQHQTVGIQVQDLPRTIREAVLVTRSLGIPYLWADALCIVQDDNVSKALEIEKMGHIYSNSALTLRAGGTARSVDDSLLDPWSEIAVVPFPESSSGPWTPVCIGPNNSMTQFLDLRGWTFQEESLSKRTLDFHGSRGVVLSCSKASLAYTAGQGLLGSDFWKPVPGQDVLDLMEGEGHIQRWHKTVENFSRRTFTFPNDRLLALTGVAQDYLKQTTMLSGQDRPADEYIAGIWKSSIIEDLMWSGGSRVNRQANAAAPKIDFHLYREPGWSWISVLDLGESSHLKAGSFVLFKPPYLNVTEETTAHLVRYTVSHANADAPFGRVDAGAITLQAQMLAMADITQEGQSRDYTRASIIEDCDYILPPEDEDRIVLLRLKIASRWKPRDGSVENGDGGLLILPGKTREGECVYRRVGMFWNWFDSDDQTSSAIWNNIEDQEVTLI